MSAKILFVDDEEEIRELMVINLETMGVDVETASSGNEALELLNNNKYDLVISDVKMANGTGVELLESLSKTEFKTPFIFLTAYLDLDSKKLLELGAEKVFFKPTKFSEIEEYIKSALNLD